MDKKRYIPDDLKPPKQDIDNVRKSQRKLAKSLRIFHLSCKEISEITGLTLQDVRRLV